MTAPLLGALQGIQSASPPCVLGDRRFAAVPASHFAPKNSPQGCFFTPLTLSGFESPLSIKIKATPTVLLLLGALQGIRTPDLLVRSQTLYPTELAAHFLRLPNYHTTTFRKNQPLFLNFFIFFKTVQNKKMSRYFLLSHIEKLSSPAIIIWSVISISSGISIARTAFVACTSANDGTAKP